MSKNVIEHLFDSRARFKLLKLLFRNADRGFTMKEIILKIQENPLLARKEVKRLLAVGLIKIQPNDQTQKNKKT